MVNRKRNYTLHFYLMAVLVALAIGAVNYLGMQYRTRIDLTADQRFTLSEGTQRLFEKLTEPINVTYYVDAEPPAKRINLERDVRDKLDELAVSSGGKLQYRIERITNEEAATKRKDLEAKGIQVTVDFLTSGTDERAEMRGVQGYFSSLEVAYGTADPKPINGIVNLVDKDDESREHRVDTLEFDIAYTVLAMRNETRRPPFPRLMKLIPGQLDMAFFVTKDMPKEFAKLADAVDSAAKQVATDNASEVTFVRTEISNEFMKAVVQPNPFASGQTVAMVPFAQGGRPLVWNDNGVRRQVPSEIYCTCVYLRFQGNDGPHDYVIGDFDPAGTAQDARTRIEDTIWEMFRPRTRLGFILPGKSEQPGQPPQSGHTQVMGYIQDTLSYETSWVDLDTVKRVPRDLACLIVIEPNRLREREIYEIDQFLQEGGNVLMLLQGWSADLNFTMAPGQSIRLTKEDEDPAFSDWARHIGLTFGQDVLLRKTGKLQPYVVQNRSYELYPTPVRLAPVVEPADLNASSVFTRGLSALPLPLVVETKLDKDRLRELKLEQTDLIRLKGDVYKFLPKDPKDPAVPLKFSMGSTTEVLEDPAATPKDEVRAQRLDHEPLVATTITGEFPNLWVDDNRNIPGWNGDPEKDKATKVAKPGKGTLVVMSTAAFLNTDYLRGYPPSDLFQPDAGGTRGNFGPVIDRGLTFYRNVSEAFIYGEDLVTLRARTGVAPRISGSITQGGQTMWFIVCIAGVPMLLLLLAAGRTFVNQRDREEYEIGLGIREAK